MTPDIEKQRRAFLADYAWRTGDPLPYYREAEIDPEVMPLVKTLNNEWTVTRDSCGGHWDWRGRPHLPYITFYVWRSSREWAGIARDALETIRVAVTERTTVSLSNDRILPERRTSFTYLRFGPWIGERAVRHLFKDEEDFRTTLDGFLSLVRNAFEESMNARRRKKGAGRRSG